MRKIKLFLKIHPFILKLISFFYRMLLLNTISVGRKNHLIYKGSFLKHCDIEIHGRNNEIVIEPLSRLSNCHVYINGDNNHIKIGNECIADHLEIWIEDSQNIVEIGANSWVTGNTHIAVIEGTRLKIGKQCLLSNDIVMRTGDSHSILNSNGQRINPSRDIEIGCHVWIGNRVILLKGTNVGDNCIIGTGSIVTKKFGSGLLLAGAPAKIIKENVNWSSERL